MARITKSSVVFSLLLVVAVNAQGQTCRAANDSSYDMIEMVKRFAVD